MFCSLISQYSKNVQETNPNINIETDSNVKIDKFFPKRRTSFFIPFMCKRETFKFDDFMFRYPRYFLFQNYFTEKSSMFDRNTTIQSAALNSHNERYGDEIIDPIPPNITDKRVLFSVYVKEKGHRPICLTENGESSFMNRLLGTLTYFTLPFGIPEDFLLPSVFGKLGSNASNLNMRNTDFKDFHYSNIDDETYENLQLDEECNENLQEYDLRNPTAHDKSEIHQHPKYPYEHNLQKGKIRATVARTEDLEKIEMQSSSSGGNDDLFFTDPMFRDMYKNWKNQTISQSDICKVEKVCFLDCCKTLCATFLKKLNAFNSNMENTCCTDFHYSNIDDETYENFHLNEECNENQQGYGLNNNSTSHDKSEKHQCPNKHNLQKREKIGATIDQTEENDKTETGSSSFGENDDMFFTDPIFRDMHKNWKN